MRRRRKSSISLSPQEFRLVLRLKARLGATSNVDVVRRGLRLLKEMSEGGRPSESYRRASCATRESLAKELRELDHLAGEGLDEPGRSPPDLWRAIRAFRVSADPTGLRLEDAYRGLRVRSRRRGGR